MKWVICKDTSIFQLIELNKIYKVIEETEIDFCVKVFSDLCDVHNCWYNKKCFNVIKKTRLLRLLE